MPAISRAQPTGYPALIFYFRLKLGTEKQTLEGRLDTIHSVYSAVAAYAPSRSKENETSKKWESELQVIRDEIIDARKVYNSKYEDALTYSGDECIYRQKLDAIIEKLDPIIADAKLIDNVYQTENPVP